VTDETIWRDRAGKVMPSRREWLVGSIFFFVATTSAVSVTTQPRHATLIFRFVHSNTTTGINMGDYGEFHEFSWVGRSEISDTKGITGCLPVVLWILPNKS
jgi:hypothetical protein